MYKNIFCLTEQESAHIQIQARKYQYKAFSLCFMETLFSKELLLKLDNQYISSIYKIQYNEARSELINELVLGNKRVNLLITDRISETCQTLISIDTDAHCRLCEETTLSIITMTLANNNIIIVCNGRIVHASAVSYLKY